MITALRERHRVPPYIDLPALIEVLSAALTLFALRASHAGAESSSGAVHDATAPDPGSPAGWRRIEKAVATITRALLEAEGR